ncbi:hypothetical protein E2C01_075216 [Portunus trituberculatus]|uniref:Uncharacterized protein n=1 Tax=Portunus trituberculatus TaxID=210409 RepID=A0A5B7IA64_PORTR|nr:hypothetical protein [Portunus trituberculatus]
MGGLEELIKKIGHGSKAARGRRMGVLQWGRTSVVTRFKREGMQARAASPASTWATPHSVLTCTAYVCLLIPSALGIALPLSPSFHSHCNALCSWLSALGITTLNLPTLLAASSIHPSWKPAGHHLTCAFLRKTGQLPCL